VILPPLVFPALMNGKAQYGLSPCTEKFRSALFIFRILFIFFTKRATLMRRSNILS